MEKRQIDAVKRKTELCTHRVHFFGRPNCMRTAYTIDMYSSTVLGMERAEYGKRIVVTLSQQLKLCIRTAYTFIHSMLQNEPFDYTEWRKDNLFKGMTVAEISQAADSYCKEFSKIEPSVVAEPLTTYQTNN